MSYEYYVLAVFPSGYREVKVFDTEQQANRQAQKYANKGAYKTNVRRDTA